MKKYLETAVETALKTGRFLAIRFKSAKKIKFKGEIDLVTDSDINAERMIIASLKKAFPSHEILAEETANLNNLTQSYGYRWIIDPIDGTTNFAHGYPLFAVSIGLEFKGEIILGAAYNPILGELFRAVKGKGAYLNNRKIRVSRSKVLSKCLLATGFPYDIRKDPVNNLKLYNTFQLKARDIRRDGSAVLNLCYTACGRFDGFWELKLKPWDTAAGSIILKEAGGRLSDFSGGKYNIYKKEILASNGLIHNQMLNIFKTTGTKKTGTVPAF